MSFDAIWGYLKAFIIFALVVILFAAARAIWKYCLHNKSKALLWLLAFGSAVAWYLHSNSIVFSIAFSIAVVSITWGLNSLRHYRENSARWTAAAAIDTYAAYKEYLENSHSRFHRKEAARRCRLRVAEPAKFWAILNKIRGKDTPAASIVFEIYRLILSPNSAIPIRLGLEVERNLVNLHEAYRKEMVRRAPFLEAIRVLRAQIERLVTAESVLATEKGQDSIAIKKEELEALLSNSGHQLLNPERHLKDAGLDFVEKRLVELIRKVFEQILPAELLRIENAGPSGDAPKPMGLLRTKYTVGSDKRISFTSTNASKNESWEALQPELVITLELSMQGQKRHEQGVRSTGVFDKVDGISNVYPAMLVNSLVNWAWYILHLMGFVPSESFRDSLATVSKKTDQAELSEMREALMAEFRRELESVTDSDLLASALVAAIEREYKSDSSSLTKYQDALGEYIAAELGKFEEQSIQFLSGFDIGIEIPTE